MVLYGAALLVEIAIVGHSGTPSTLVGNRKKQVVPRPSALRAPVRYLTRILRQPFNARKKSESTPNKDVLVAVGTPVNIFAVLPMVAVDEWQKPELLSEKLKAL